MMSGRTDERLVRLDGPSVRTLHVNLDDALREESDQLGGCDATAVEPRVERSAVLWAV